jgi:hypothetical protein
MACERRWRSRLSCAGMGLQPRSCSPSDRIHAESGSEGRQQPENQDAQPKENVTATSISIGSSANA